MEDSEYTVIRKKHGGSMEIYVVKQGDTVAKIAETYAMEADTLIYDNQLENPDALAVGQALLLNTGGKEQSRSIRSGGYAYTFITPVVLNSTLPFLSELAVFSYGFTPEGGLVNPPREDEWMVNWARQYHVLPFLTLAPLDAAGSFDNTRITTLVNDPAAQNRLLDELLLVMKSKGYAGLSIDFEYVPAEVKDAYNEFVRFAAERLHREEYQVAVALAPKTSAQQRGLLYEGVDYRALGEAADFVIVMTYEWGYTYGPPMAVAPIDKVRQVLTYAVSEIPPEKIMMGIPNYGYDWPLPYERGITAARTIGAVEAVQTAIRENAEIRFDEVAQTPFFTYVSNGIRHEVWFEDVRSLQAKFDLLQELGLRGVMYWQLMRWFRANWLLLQDKFAIVKSPAP